MTLEECLLEYKDLTIKSIESLKKNNIDELCNFIDNRQVLIDKLKELDKSEIKEIESHLNIMFLEKELEKLFIEKKQNLKIKLINIKKSNNANRTYNNNKNNIDGFLNLKI